MYGKIKNPVTTNQSPFRHLTSSSICSDPPAGSTSPDIASLVALELRAPWGGRSYRAADDHVMRGPWKLMSITDFDGFTQQKNENTTSGFQGLCMFLVRYGWIW